MGVHTPRDRLGAGAVDGIDWRLLRQQMESFWALMQVELLNRERWNTRLELANAILEYLEIFHNRQRRHSSIGMLSPIEYGLRYADDRGSRSSILRARNPGHTRAVTKPGVPLCSVKPRLLALHR